MYSSPAGNKVAWIRNEYGTRFSTAEFVVASTLDPVKALSYDIDEDGDQGSHPSERIPLASRWQW